VPPLAVPAPPEHHHDLRLALPIESLEPVMASCGVRTSVRGGSGESDART